MKPVKNIITALILAICLYNIVSVYVFPNSVTKAKLAMASLSRGDQYFGRLTLWYIFAKQGDWVNAAKLESDLDQADISGFKATHQPAELKKYINNLVVKPNKTAEDWIELSRVQMILGKLDDAKESISKAKNIDPIRDDISQIFYQLVK